jgi:hypothetical protein
MAESEILVGSLIFGSIPLGLLASSSFPPSPSSISRNGKVLDERSEKDERDGKKIKATEHYENFQIEISPQQNGFTMRSRVDVER